MINKGKLTCTATNKPITYLSYDMTNLPVSKRSYHFYTEDDELITVDHVYPKSLGGSEMDVENLQPMIGEHNWAKRKYSIIKNRLKAYFFYSPKLISLLLNEVVFVIVSPLYLPPIGYCFLNFSSSISLSNVSK